MKVRDVAELSEKLKATTSILGKIELLSGFLKKLRGDELKIVTKWLEGNLRQGKIMVGYGTVRDVLKTVRVSKGSGMEIVELDRYFSRIKDERTRTGKLRILGEAFMKLDELERNFVASLLFGELRQGASEGVLKKAISRTFNVREEDVERALTLMGDLGRVVEKLEKGEDIRRVGITIMQPVKPMLAEQLHSIELIEPALRNYHFEFKLDGVRVQIHKMDDEVKIFSRHLKDITVKMPEVVEIVKKIPARSFIVEGEVTALSRDGRPLPFQLIMRRIGRKYVEKSIKELLPLKLQLFDVLYLEGEALLSTPLRERLRILKNLADEYIVEGRSFKKLDDVVDFLNKAIQMGHEGLMAKELESPYRAGTRGSHWLKIKPFYTLDLVILGAEWGHGRRKGWLSNVHLGTIDKRSGKYLPLGKTFKGLSDEELELLTRELLEIKIEERKGIVFVQPKIVVEVAFNEIQRSPHYSSGFALRFARILQFRFDKKPEEIDDIERIKELYEAQFKYKGKLI